MGSSATSGMAIDILKYKNSSNILSECKELRAIDCFKAYADNPEDGLPVKEVIMYVVLLYSKDSFLNKKPPEILSQRRVKAASLSGLNTDSAEVIEKLFDLGSEKVRDLIMGYLIHQNQMIWTERCIIEAQIVENQRIRFKPITNKVVIPSGKDDSKKVEVDADDKYIVEASSKKSLLTDHFAKYSELLKRYDLELFGDHENVKNSIKIKRTTIESVAH